MLGVFIIIRSGDDTPISNPYNGGGSGHEGVLLLGLDVKNGVLYLVVWFCLVRWQLIGRSAWCFVLEVQWSGQVFWKSGHWFVQLGFVCLLGVSCCGFSGAALFSIVGSHNGWYCLELYVLDGLNVCPFPCFL